MSFILPRRLLNRSFPVPALLAVWLLAGCAGPQPDGVDAVATQVETVSPPASGEPVVAKDTAYELLKQAETAESPLRESLLLQASANYQRQGDYARMGRTLQEIPAEGLGQDLLVPYSLQYGDWAINQRRLSDADRVLLDARLNTGLDNASAAELHGLRARLYQLEAKPLDALNERIAQSLLVPESGQKEVCDAIWRLISGLRAEDIQFLESADASNRAEEQLLAGWLALARIQRNDAGNIDKQLADVKDWQRTYPLHPANRFMPADMEMVADGSSNLTHRIALLLPLTGKRASAGQALRDGFMTMHYKQLASGEADVQIDLVDSNGSPDLLNIYNNAVAQGAQLIIGPLEREQVQLLVSQSSLTVPTLALNNPPPLASGSGLARGPDMLYQFSLNPEDDVIQTADAAAASKLRKALVIAPQGERGERLVQAFLRRWQTVGGEASQMRYSPGTGNYSVQLADALGVDLASGQLSPGKSLPDMVFFVGSGGDAAVMKETLSRDGASAVPVYTTSQVLVGQRPDQRANGMRLCVSPWQAGSGPLRAEGAASPADTEMLFAMGADAQTLYSRLATLAGNSSLHVSGNTGYLSMDDNRRVVRTLVCGEMQDGQLKIQPDSGRR